MNHDDIANASVDPHDSVQEDNTLASSRSGIRGVPGLDSFDGPRQLDSVSRILSHRPDREAQVEAGVHAECSGQTAARR